MLFNVGHIICFKKDYRIAGNVCGNLIVRFAVETENTQFYSTQYYFYAISIGVMRKGSDCHMSMCTEAQRGMALLKYRSRNTSITKLSSSLLTPKEEEAADDFIKKAVNHRYSIRITLVVIFFAAL